MLRRRKDSRALPLTFGREISVRSVDHAAEFAGGYAELAARLGVRPDQVIDWSLGLRKPDTTTFLFVLDVIMHETQKLSSAALAFELAQQAITKARKSSKAP
jgi:hypothetical protein